MSRHPENPFTEPQLAARYESWYSGKGRQADDREKQLLKHLLAAFPNPGSVLEIGCGTGHFTHWLAEQGWRVTGLDASPAMLAQAVRLNEGAYVQADALHLPFADRSFDLVAMITTLEFLPVPLPALQEAMRVARTGLVLGVLNRWSLLARGYRARGKSPWLSARFYSPFELKQLVRRAAGQRAGHIAWRTTLWPSAALGHLPLPCGGFIGMGVHLRARPKPSPGNDIKPAPDEAVLESSADTRVPPYDAPCRTL